MQFIRKTLYTLWPCKDLRRMCFSASQTIKPHQPMCCYFRDRGTHNLASVARARVAGISLLTLFLIHRHFVF